MLCGQQPVLSKIGSAAKTLERRQIIFYVPPTNNYRESQTRQSNTSWPRAAITVSHAARPVPSVPLGGGISRTDDDTARTATKSRLVDHTCILGTSVQHLTPPPFPPSPLPSLSPSTPTDQDRKPRKENQPKTRLTCTRTHTGLRAIRHRRRRQFWEVGPRRAQEEGHAPRRPQAPHGQRRPRAVPRVPAAAAAQAGALAGPP